MRNTLICTVGTSLFRSNLQHLSESKPGLPENWRTIKEHFDNLNYPQLAKELLKIAPDQRILGAEINTIEETIRNDTVQLEHLVFLVSETEDGINTGKLLKYYFEARSDLKLKSVESIIIEKLQPNDPKLFKIQGLRNLVRNLGEVIHRFGKEHVAIDATGGYKAQIAVALLTGQALDLPVFYKFEQFTAIIDFPPLPISLDFLLLGRNASLLTDLERNQTLERKVDDPIEEKLRVFMDEVIEDNTIIYELNAIGQLYLTAFRLQNPNAPKLKKLSDSERKKPTFGNDHHYPKGFTNFVNEVWRETPWIHTCHSTSYAKQKGITNIGFDIEYSNQDKPLLIGSYVDNNQFGAKYALVLSDHSMESLTWAADQLNQKYRAF